MADQERSDFCETIETNNNKFAISNHTALRLDVQALRSYLRLICEYELKMADQGRSGFCVVFTMNLCALKLKQTLISLPF